MTQKTIQLSEEVQEIVSHAKLELSEMLVKKETVVKKIGEALQKQYAETPEKICSAIKELLREEIQKKAISAELIEDYCPSEWKNQVKARAGAKGAVVSTANRERRADSQSVDSVAIQDLQTKVQRLEGFYGEFMPKAKAVVRAAEDDGEYVRIPKADFAPFAELIGGTSA